MFVIVHLSVIRYLSTIFTKAIQFFPISVDIEEYLVQSYYDSFILLLGCATFLSGQIEPLLRVRISTSVVTTCKFFPQVNFVSRHLFVGVQTKQYVHIDWHEQ